MTIPENRNTVLLYKHKKKIFNKYLGHVKLLNMRKFRNINYNM